MLGFEACGVSPPSPGSRVRESPGGRALLSRIRFSRIRSFRMNSWKIESLENRFLGRECSLDGSPLAGVAALHFLSTEFFQGLDFQGFDFQGFSRTRSFKDSFSRTRFQGFVFSRTPFRNSSHSFPRIRFPELVPAKGNPQQSCPAFPRSASIFHPDAKIRDS